MAQLHFNNQFINEVKQHAAIAEVAKRYDALLPAGRNFKMLCPFHNDTNPSLTVFPATNTFKCFSCDAAGDTIRLVQKMENVSFPKAILQLCKQFGIALPESRPHGWQEKAADPHKELHEALEEAQRMYQRGLAKSPAALDYLTKTRKFSEDTLHRFGIGVVASGILPFYKQATQEALLETGMIRQSKHDASGYYDFFRHRIMIPLYNESKKLIGFGGRTIADASEKNPKWLNSSQSVLFNKHKELFGMHLARESLRMQHEVVVVEGFFDVMTLHQHGYHNTVAPMGTGLSQEQAKRLFDVACNVILAFDGDNAGQKATDRAIQLLLPFLHPGKSIFVVRLPQGSDPDSYLRLAGPSAWETLRSGVPVSTYIIETIRKKYDCTIPENQMRAVAEFHEWVKPMPDTMLKHAITQYFSREIGIPMSLLESTADDS